MDNENIKELQDFLEDEIVILKRDILRYKEASRPVSPDNSIGRLTRMDAIQSKSINEAALTKARNQLKSYENALTRINNEDFGVCSKCKEDIPIERIMAMPGTSLCTKCIS